MNESTRQLVMWLIPGAPLAAAIVTALLGAKLLRERSHLPCWAAIAVAAICSFTLLLDIVPNNFTGHTGAPIVASGYQFLEIGGFNVRVDLRADAMTAIMLSMVTFVSFLVAMFGAGYMKGDPGYPRFFAEISLFVFSMCMLVLAGNFLLMFVFWEAVGLCSYLLIGFWYQRPSAAAAAMKAFVVNRIGDFGFVLGVFLIWTTFGSLDFADTLGQPEKLAAAGTERITLICLLLFLGAMGKSAQFPLHVWLPDAMEGPTPVSALIHAATMVTAGVYLVARSTPLFVLAPTAQMVVAGIGATTAILAALTALTQNDLKRVLAYSTVSQLGYMFMALGAGVGGLEAATVAAAAGMFHLFTHAFFKALLFLAAGSVMHSMGDVIDMRRFSGLRRVLPITHWTFLCGAAALAGVPLLAGFWSKDDILAVIADKVHHSEHSTYYHVIMWIAIVTALLTAFYTFRAYFMTFWGAERFPEEAGHHPHESPPVMAWPLRILAVCALLVGLAFGPTHLFSGYIQHAQGLGAVESHGLHWEVMAISAVVALAGIGLAWLFYVRSPGIPERLAKTFDPLYELSLHKFYFDELFVWLFVAPARALAWLSDWFDRTVVDRIVDGVGMVPLLLSRVPVFLHNGLVSTYALLMLTGVVGCVLVVLKICLQLLIERMKVLLLLTLAIPAVAAVLLMVFRNSMAGHAPRWVALAASVATLLVSIALASEFREQPVPSRAENAATSGLGSFPVQPRFEIRYPWFKFPATEAAASDAQGFQFDFHLGLDGISIALIVLTTLLTVSCVLVSWESIANREAEFYTSLLALETGLIGVFCAFDLMLFYVSFEFTLIPLFFMIGMWGGPQRRYAAVKFFLYTLAGSLITLVGLVALVLLMSKELSTPCSIPDLAAHLASEPLGRSTQIALFLALSAGFMVKVPVIPLHTWLPLAHVEAPTAGSILLAGVLLKLGTYGFLRLCLPLFPEACLVVGLPLLGTLAVGGIVYGSLCALAQRDIKKLVAYSSVAHLGFCMLGLFALNAAGITGGVLQMINHGLSTGGLFLLVGMIYERYHTRQLDDLGGLASRLPLLAVALVFVSLSSIGLPGLNGFVGEILSLAGMFARHPLYAVLGATGLVLGAWYLLSMLQTLLFGPLREPHHGGHHVGDMNLREALALAPICALCLWIGVRPQPLVDLIKPDVEAVAALYTDREVDTTAMMEKASRYEHRD